MTAEVSGKQDFLELNMFEIPEAYVVGQVGDTVERDATGACKIHGGESKLVEEQMREEG